MTSKSTKQWILVACLTPVLLAAIWLSINVYKNSTERASIKDDFSKVNDIYYGLLSVNEWEDEIRNIAANQIEDFSLSRSQDSILRIQISQLLYDMIDKADSMVDENDETVKGKIRKFAINVFVDKEKVRRQVPEFTNTIVQNLTSEKSKERLQAIAIQKLDELAAQTYDSTNMGRFQEFYLKYDTEDRDSFNEITAKRAEKLQHRTYLGTYFLLGIVALFLLPWLKMKSFPLYHKPFFLLSVALALIVLLVGLTTPMIEIDARIERLDFILLGEQVRFTDQMLFFRSKSILQVVGILLETEGIDSIFVGILILAFSVILPIGKLISTGVYLFSGDRTRKNGLLSWLAFRSGKWSMADVMVVAIFMSYVGFSGILDDQLEDLNRDTASVTSVTTNLTSLQPGFILFVSFVIYGMILAVVLERITRKPLPSTGAGEPPHVVSNSPQR